MHDTGDVAQQGQQDVDPEMLADAHLKKHAQRGQQDGENDTNEVHWVGPFRLMSIWWLNPASAVKVPKISGFGDHADLVQGALKIAEPLVEGVGLDAVKPLTQRLFLVALAVVPGTTLQAHDQHVIADEMGAHAAAQKPPVSLVRAEGAQGFGIGNASLGTGRIHRGSKVADAGNGRTHARSLPSVGDPVTQAQILA